MLAVSGGIDSMVLMHAVAHHPGAARDRLVVASFDHGTGAHATAALELVRHVAESWGLCVVSARSAAPLRGEAALRSARWRFLEQVADAHAARIATGHTRDDHVETIVMRELRGSGARGLSALRAPSPIVRPLLALARADVQAYATAHALSWVSDPSNADRVYLRNRVRHDLLPALVAVRPTLASELLSLADRSAALRRDCLAAVRPLVLDVRPGRVVARGVTDRAWSPDARALLWQSLAELGGIALDRRGTERLASFSCDGRVGRCIPLAGGFEAIHRRDSIELRRRPAATRESMLLDPAAETRYGLWHFRAVPETTLQDGEDHDPWRAWLPADTPLHVRAWRDGDRMTPAGQRLRRVKRFLSDARVLAADRAGWPVVVAEDEIVWIPGVRRARAAAVRSGRPRVCIVCERVIS